MIYQKMVVAWVVVLFAAVIVFSSQEKKVNTSEIEKAVLTKLSQIQEAAESMDPDAVFSHVLENDKGALITDGRLQLTRQEALESTKRGFQGLQKVSYKFNEQHVTVLSSTIALVVGEGSTFFSTADGRSFTAPFAQSVVFKLTDGEWMVLHAHRSFPQAR